MNPDTEEIEEQFLDFQAGTHREEIWRYFDERRSKGVVYMLYGIDPTMKGELTDYLRKKEMCQDCDNSFCAYSALGICRYPLVGGTRPEIDDDGCKNYISLEVE